MGGNRKGKLRTYLNNFITMVVAGLWHGASWMFVIWGAMHGVALVIHKACKTLFLDKIKDNGLTKFIWWTITFVFITVTWIFFRAGMLQENGMETVGLIFSKLFYEFDWAYMPVFTEVRLMWTIFLLVAFIFHFTPEKWYERIKDAFVGSNWIVKLIIFAIVVQLIINFNQENVQQNLYAQF
jgi:D-alanyl-lipoteichoic acid acyltransferase DltB (MBOAT superfamily)